MKKIFKISEAIAGTITTLLGIASLLFDGDILVLWVKQNIPKPVFSVLIPVILFLLGLSLIGSLVHRILNETRSHRLKVGSKRFNSFFSKWYSQEGNLSIFCDDLNGWVSTGNNVAILDALRGKSRAGELCLFLGTRSPQETVQELINLGAKVIDAPPEIIVNYSFSCVSVLGNNSTVIVRNKQRDNRVNIIFEEVTDTYVSGLLNALINNDRRAEQHV